MTLTRDALLMRLGSAQTRAPAAWRLLDIRVTEHDGTLTYRLNRDKLRKARRREGRYLLRTNLTVTDPVKLWSYYRQLVAVEEAFRVLKGDLAAIRPVFHQDPARIEAHTLIAFLAYCLHVSLGHRLKALAPGLNTRCALEKFAAVQMVDVHIPTTDGRELWLIRYTRPEPDLKLLLQRLPPYATRPITAENHSDASRRFALDVVQTSGGTPVTHQLLNCHDPRESAKSG